jgi:predicted Zn-dependent protease
MRRVEAFATERPLHSETDRGKALEFLGVRQARAHRPREAVRAYRAAVELVPHRYLYVAWLTSGLEIPDLYEARTAALALTQRFPELPLGWAALAGVSAQLEDAQGYRSSLARMRAMNMTPAERREVRQFLVRYPKVWPDFPLAREDSVRHAQRKL